MSESAPNVYTFHPEYKISVHEAHCCARHGCKYGDSDCPVALKTYEQAYPCEMCEDPADLRAAITALIKEYRWSRKIHRISASRTFEHPEDPA